jgi:hypothetical protein
MRLNALIQIILSSSDATGVAGTTGLMHGGVAGVELRSPSGLASPRCGTMLAADCVKTRTGASQSLRPSHPPSFVIVAGAPFRLGASGQAAPVRSERDGELAPVKVTETLDGVESPQAREADRPLAPPRMRLFVSYAHNDAKKIGPLSTHLTILGQRGYIQTWQDTQLIAGEEWEGRIQEELGRADIVLLLYSTASCASKFIQHTEAPLAVELAKSKENPCTLIVVPLDRKDWDTSVALEQQLKKL